jgi:hypothetical protein
MAGKIKITASKIMHGKRNAKIRRRKPPPPGRSGKPGPFGFRIAVPCTLPKQHFGLDRQRLGKTQTSLLSFSACTIFSENRLRLGKSKQVCFCTRLALSLQQTIFVSAMLERTRPAPSLHHVSQ